MGAAPERVANPAASGTPESLGFAVWPTARLRQQDFLDRWLGAAHFRTRGVVSLPSHPSLLTGADHA